MTTRGILLLAEESPEKDLEDVFMRFLTGTTLRNSRKNSLSSQKYSALTRLATKLSRRGVFILSLKKQRRKILISNDDGIGNDGLEILKEKLSSVCDVYVMAPSKNQSGVSSKISLTSRLEYVKISENEFSCSGTPADCVISALCHDFFYEDGKPVKFDAVFSGINHGPNLGTDTIYSGTIAAARQAALYNLPGIAVSLESPEFDYAVTNFNFEPIAEFCAKNLETLISLCKDDLFVSINALSSDEYKEAVFTSLCRRDYNDTIEIVESSGDKCEGKCVGGKIATEGGFCSDYEAVRSGKISVSLIHANPESEKAGSGAEFIF